MNSIGSFAFSLAFDATRNPMLITSWIAANVTIPLPFASAAHIARIDAIELNVKAFSFEDDDIIPTVSVEANFELDFKKDVTQEALSNWEDSNGDPIAWCLNFFWNFDEVDSDDWEGYLDTNDGVEMYLV